MSEKISLDSSENKYLGGRGFSESFVLSITIDIYI